MTQEIMTVKDVDVRAFAYAMEPAWLRQQWRVDRALAALGRAEKALAEAEQALDAARRQHDAEVAETIARAQLGLDPGAHRRALTYLSALGERVAQQARERSAKLQACIECRKDCTEQQLLLEALKVHKADALSEFANDLRQRGAAEQDRDWLARSLRQPANGGAP